MAVKTDISKAYDRLEWDFIAAVLERLGFHQHWIGLIMQCISSVTYSFLINGSPRGKVIPSRGIHQGDLLSPYIFILCSEVLSDLCNKAQAEGRIQGIRVSRGSPRINHLLFADDTMFFLKAERESTLALKEIMHRYGTASGQSINFEKSSVTFSRRAPAELKNMVHTELQIQKEGGVGKYLGLPEIFGRKKKDMFSSIVDRIVQKASSWSNRYLSAAGKMVMLQSVLSSIPSYSMTCFKLHVSLCNHIQSALTRFWWDDKTGKRKMAWLAWDKMTLSKSNGGLGIRDVQAFNDAFLAKISWRLKENPDCLLGRILLSKYCPDGNLLTCTALSAASHGWQSILLGRDLLVKNLGWIVGDGASIKIWDDAWLSLEAPCRPMGPATSETASLCVKDLIQEGNGEWNREFVQTVLPFEEERVLSITPSTKGASDVLKWLGTKTGEYKVKTGYYTAMAEVTEEILEGEATPEFDWRRTVWNLKIAPKVKMFTWKCLKGLTSSPLVPWILWALWKARNKYVFENFDGSPADILSQAIGATKEWAAAQDKKERGSQRVTQPLPHEAGTVARSDVAWSALTKNAGLGWVVVTREQRTLFKLGIAFTPSALVSEALALKEAVMACFRIGVKDVRFESDSRMLINAINGKDPLFEIYGVVEDIHILSNAFDDVSFAWLSRERNGEADMLAKNALRVV
ncbi:uncharacterized protein LOC125591512 [Brassica napus]|uniref:uncharacterized protein LOC125591512 n=1 Tax=Brassica napus TaxID=3708 RepID=UPI00207A0CE6|nr:uncharacterized protein LOC125591512 [Brassica napus]